MELTIDKIKYTISNPLNSWDMNYHVIDELGNDHLVDLQDVIDWKYDGFDDDKLPKDLGANINDVRDMIDEMGIELASWKSI